MSQESTASPSPYNVTELTSNVKASNRNFACKNEEIVYRCVTISTNSDSEPEPFITEWQWNGTAIDKTFNSNDRIGENNTCSTLPNNLNFLHLTLVLAENDTCVSLLIVRSSLSSYVNDNVNISCLAFGANGPITHSMMSSLDIQHTTVSGESCTCMCIILLCITVQLLIKFYN